MSKHQVLVNFRFLSTPLKGAEATTGWNIPIPRCGEHINWFGGGYYVRRVDYVFEYNDARDPEEAVLSHVEVTLT